MEHLDNDMDDLFQKAGELYPLKISESDWEAVAGKLQDPNSGDLTTSPGLAVRGTGKKRRWRLLLLLIPLSLAGLIYFSVRQPADQAISKTGKANSNPALNTDEIKKKPSGIAEEKASATEQPQSDNKVDKKVNQLNTEGSEQAAFSKSRSVTSRIRPGGASSAHSAAGQRPVGNVVAGTPADGGSTGSQVNNDRNMIDSRQPSSANSSNLTTEGSVAPAAAAAASVTQSSEPAPTKNNPVAEEKSKGITQDSSLKKKTPGADAKSSRGFYAGILAGPDLSSVKFQSVKQTGFSLGVLVGYRFNKRIAIESGLLWDKKYYYSDGEYFKKENIGIPPAEKVVSVDGSCYMFEIPLNFRYDFATAKNHGFFAKTGLSSYIGMKDQYTLQLDYGGNPYPRNWPAKNAPANIFSILQFSGGYERSIGAKTNLRVEPYVKIPLQGVGTGSMPISSYGIYFGITHSFR